MQHDEMSKVFAALAVGDKVHVREAGGRLTPYTVRGIRGKAAREVWMAGRCKAGRVLVDDGSTLWIRRSAKRTRDGSAHARVLEIKLDDGGLSAAVAAATAAARHLPDGYSISTDPRADGFWYTPVFRGSKIGIAVAGARPLIVHYSDPLESALACMRHYADTLIADAEVDRSRLRGLRSMRETLEVRADRAERALQQISEMLDGAAPSHRTLPDGVAPERIAADVGHRLMLVHRYQG